jgi:A/G-specific adenine glycosylase
MSETPGKPRRSARSARTRTPVAAGAGTTASALLAWFRANARDLPWRRARDPYAVWISEIMLQQTQVRTVIPYWQRWMRELPDVRALAEADEDRVLKLWEGLGYYSRARNLQRAARRVLGDFGGTLPATVEQLLELPGIGPYTAGAIASIAFNRPAPILDGNVTRVLARLKTLRGDPKTRTVSQRLWQEARELVEAAAGLADPHETNCAHVNQALMELGATVCTPASPACPQCPLARCCLARRARRQKDFPETPARPATTARTFATAVIEHRGRHLLRRRTDGDVNAGLWEFPNEEIGAEASAEAVLARWFRIPVERWTRLPDVRHAITRYRITQHVWRCTGSPSLERMLGEWRWVRRRELGGLALTGPHRKLANSL